MQDATRETLRQLALDRVLAGTETLQRAAESLQQQIKVITNAMGNSESNEVGRPTKGSG
jgi:prefoldin subunit 5